MGQVRTPVQAGLGLRRMQPADLEAVARIEAEVQAFPWGKGQLSDSLAAGHQGWVLVRAGASSDEPVEVAAYALLMPVLDEIELLTIAVARASQRQGLGRRLLGWLLQRARAEGMNTMFLEVALGNQSALSLYRSLGFEAVGRRRNYYRAPDGRQDDAWVMRRRLDALQDVPEEDWDVIG